MPGTPISQLQNELTKEERASLSAYLGEKPMPEARAKAMVARDRIEPPTRGFSVHAEKRPKWLIEREFVHQECEIF